jgi:hypothetical protein
VQSLNDMQGDLTESDDAADDEAELELPDSERRLLSVTRAFRANCTHIMCSIHGFQFTVRFVFQRSATVDCRFELAGKE